jgi:phosphosulfolactate synthase
MVIDKGLGLRQTRDLLELAGHCVDYLKLSFGTSALYPLDVLKSKLQLIREHGVESYPGGTFLEVAHVQGRTRQYISRVAELGFDAVEISDGTVPMTTEERMAAISFACAEGLKVFTEVGKKHPADQVPKLQLREQITADLEEGACKVIVEGRESGKGVVIFDHNGSVNEDELEYLAQAVADVAQLIWEAPLKKQQEALIMRFGPNVNLGNIPPQEVLAVESLRVGLRGDTLREALFTNPRLRSGRD